MKNTKYGEKENVNKNISINKINKIEAWLDLHNPFFIRVFLLKFSDLTSK